MLIEYYTLSIEKVAYQKGIVPYAIPHKKVSRILGVSGILITPIGAYVLLVDAVSRHAKFGERLIFYLSNAFTRDPHAITYFLKRMRFSIVEAVP